MPLLALTDAQSEAALEAADSDLKYLLSEVGVPEEVQAAVPQRVHLRAAVLWDR